ncbi:Sulfur carrier protein adenylyltransferase ThiF [Polaromonas sp. CG9_12]|uniref:molybdopterin-synthase adenylyltransferase MoeB n=1 Tax=Polaromonas sp. CG_9.11 TaxID=2787730 RepID=UPI0004DDC5D5|nr:molybdopterin-synthase adenylyltransferase MoeB [Polaromonas sp. CG_9.11]MBG6076554.1 adenylyltransferase/sulfurtransferase [Polaromonas sp. CG_9.11]CDS49935.1 Sulfur carrier protein adenylyltransferase ThiF [Polaromonas sp. CG9_12]
MLPELTSSELRRFNRQIILPEFGIEAQRRLKAGSVLLIGLGGLGSPASLYLAAAGVGRIGLLDADVVDETNLQRQIVHGQSTLGRLKNESAEARLLDINPNVQIERHDVRLGVDNALALIAQYDVIMDGSDNFPTRYLVNDACVKLGKPDVYGGVLRFDGQLSVFDARTGPCYRCLFPEPPPQEFAPNCSEAGVLGVLPGVIGSLQATEVLKLLSGIGSPMIGRMLIYDGLDLSFNTVHIAKDPDCPVCSHAPQDIVLRETVMVCAAPVGRSISSGGLQAKLQARDEMVIVDVRNPAEWLSGRIPGAIGWPKPELEHALHESGAAPLPRDRDIVLVCQSGMRSSSIIKSLVEAGYDPLRLYNLEQGMAAWPGDVQLV